MYAIYSRQSLDKKDSISIETQTKHCAAMIGDEQYRTYIDKGFSGKNTARPQFQKMMEDVRNGIVNCVVVYKLDRLSRSLLDFATMMDAFGEYGVSFLSTKENFDTSTPIGKAMLNIIMVFAQLERETIQMRVTDAYYARHERGAYDGKAPFGFRKCKVIHDGKKACSIEEDEDTAPVLRGLFETYAGGMTTLSNMAKDLNQRGIPSPAGGKWDSSKLSRIMANPVYVKADVNVYEYYRSLGVSLTNPVDDFSGDNGILSYGKWDRSKRKFEQLDKIRFSVGLHQGLIDSSMFLRCQNRLNDNKQVANGAKGKYTWLTGIIKCAYCGHALSAKRACAGTLYFACSGRINCGICDAFICKWYIFEVEAAVEGELLKALEKKRDLSHMVRDEESAQERRIKVEIVKLGEQIERLVDALAAGSADNLNAIVERLSELETERNDRAELLKRIRTEQNAQKKMFCLGMMIEQWNELETEHKRVFARKLINRILLSNDGVEIIWNYNFS